MPEKDNGERLEFRYSKKGDYRPVYVNGAYGGKNVKGEIVINFFTDMYPLPESETYERQGELLGKRTHTAPGSINTIIERNIECGIVMTQDVARSVCKWLETILEEGMDE